MAAAVGYTELGAVLKKIFEQPGRVIDACFSGHPFMKKMKKSEGFGGGLSTTAAPYAAGFQLCPIKYARGQGQARTWATAVANASAPKFASFRLDPKDSYHYQTVDPKILASAKKDVQSFVTGMESFIEEDVLAALGNQMAFDMFRDASGCIGYVDATWAGAATTLPIAIPYNNINGFETGMKLVTANDTAGALHDAGLAFTILAIDATAVPPTVIVDTLVGHPNMVARAGNTIPLFREGDYVNAADRLGLTGMEQWIPQVAPAVGDMFLGQNRYFDVRKLAGLRIDRTGFTAEEALLDARGEIRKFDITGGDAAVCSPAFFTKLEKELEGKGVYNRDSAADKAKVGYDRLLVGGVEVTQEPFCPDTTLWVTTMKDWEYYWMGDAEVFLMNFGAGILHPVPAATGNEYEIRAASWGDVGNHLPGRTCRTTVSL